VADDDEESIKKSLLQRFLSLEIEGEIPGAAPIG